MASAAMIEARIRDLQAQLQRAQVQASNPNPRIAAFGANRVATLSANLARWQATVPVELGGSKGGPGAVPTALPTVSDQAGLLQQGKSFLAEVPTPAIYAAGAAAAVGLGVGAVALASRRRKKRSSRSSKRKAGTSKSRPGSRRSSTKRSSAKRRNRRGGAVKDRYKGRKVYRTKRGQPYILLASGKARFVRA